MPLDLASCMSDSQSPTAYVETIPTIKWAKTFLPPEAVTVEMGADDVVVGEAPPPKPMENVLPIEMVNPRASIWELRSLESRDTLTPVAALSAAMLELVAFATSTGEVAKVTIELEVDGATELVNGSVATRLTFPISPVRALPESMTGVVGEDPVRV